MNGMNKVSAIILGAGSSTRMGFDKLSYVWKGQTVLERSFHAFDDCDAIDEIILVTGSNMQPALELSKISKKPCYVIRGGQTRGESAANGIRKASGDIVAIHDAARPFVSKEIIEKTVRAADEYGAAAPAVPVKDTIKIADEHWVKDTPLRSTLFAMQTPQCFKKQQYLDALAKLDSVDVTDDCQLMEQTGYAVYLTEGSYDNYKITTIQDLKGSSTMRIGHGYDVHKLVEGRKLILGGVEIPYEKGLLGHSDADVLAHAIMDALLGAAALGDIGHLFPDNDPAYSGADSLVLMRRVVDRVKAEGYGIGNVDATILCQRPKLAPHIISMREKIASALDINVNRVSVKATTEEGLGFTGNGEGIATHAVALLND